MSALNTATLIYYFLDLICLFSLCLSFLHIFAWFVLLTLRKHLIMLSLLFAEEEAAIISQPSHPSV